MLAFHDLRLSQMECMITEFDSFEKTQKSSKLYLSTLYLVVAPLCFVTPGKASLASITWSIVSTAVIRAAGLLDI